MIAVDFADVAAPDRLVDDALRRVGRVDILVNNAGGSRPMNAPDDAEV